jgi:proline dehydrogenase
MPEQKRIIKGIVFRLVKRYIAGLTTESALEAVRKLNERGMHTTVTLLNDHVDQFAKARYNANAYVQLIKQVSRLNLDSDVSLRLSQVGYGLESGLMERNMQSVIEAANENKLRVWIEGESQIDESELLALYRGFRGSSGMLGIEITPAYEDSGMLKQISPKDMVKLNCRLHNEEAGKDRKESFGALKLYNDYISKLMKKGRRLTVLDHNAHIMSRIAASNKGYRSEITFEAPLGSSGKGLSKLAEEKFKVSVYVPYGKDWVPYLINKLTEGRLRNIAIALLNGEKAGHGHG